MSKILLIPGIVFILILFGCKQNNSITPERRNIVEAVFASGSAITKNHYIVTSQTEGYLEKYFSMNGILLKLAYHYSSLKMNHKINNWKMRRQTTNILNRMQKITLPS
jgi:hypothetical protein